MSIESNAGNYPAALVAQAVSTELWTPVVALNIAADTSRAKHKAEIYISLLTTGKLGDQQYKDALARALEATRFITNGVEKVRLLAMLAQYLQDKPLAEALEEGLQTLPELNKKERLEAIRVLAPYLEGERLIGAVRAALEAEDEEYRYLEGETRWVLATAALAERSVRDDKAWMWGWERAPSASRSFSSEGDVAEAFAILARHIEGKHLTRLTHQVDEFLRPVLPNEDETVVACWSTAVAILNGRMKDRATSTALAQNIDDKLVLSPFGARQPIGRNSEEKWAQVLAILAERLEGDARHWALLNGLTAALTVRYAKERVKALVSYIRFLGDAARDWLLAHLLEVARQICSREDRAEALAMMLPHLQGRSRVALMTMGLEILQLIEKEEEASMLSSTPEHSRALSALAPYLEGEWLARGLKIAITISEEKGFVFSSNALAALAPNLEGSLLRQALAACV
jgi:alkylhydroperoxidase/carboxymuconolactone decarboxylase family protein YurZ